MGSAGCPRGDVSQRDLSAVYLFSPVSVRAEEEGGRYQGVDRYLNFVLWSVERFAGLGLNGVHASATLSRKATPFCTRYTDTGVRWRSVDVKPHTAAVLRNVACNYLGFPCQAISVGLWLVAVARWKECFGAEVERDGAFLSRRSNVKVQII